ncbi:MAG: hypothetical protein K0V04_22545 [Deltaproteobacteria bacterium]|nr:hypothetical protein [Deltaproteobacteria bacterium]
MRKVLGLALVIVGMAVALWLWFVRPPAPPSVAAGPVVGASKPSVDDAAGDAGARDAATVRPDRSKPGRAKRIQERNEMRRRILEAVRARERAAAEDEPSPSPGSTSGAPPDSIPFGGDESSSVPDESGPASGGLVDRTGTHGEMVRILNEDLMPLADECYTLAREQQPQLAGLLVVDFEMVGDPEVGTVVESVHAGQGNELEGPVLMECMQQSILSLSWPQSDQTGWDAVSLSMRFSPDE